MVNPLTANKKSTRNSNSNHHYRLRKTSIIKLFSLSHSPSISKFSSTDKEIIFITSPKIGIKWLSSLMFNSYFVSKTPDIYLVELTLSLSLLLSIPSKSWNSVDDLPFQIERNNKNFVFSCWSLLKCVCVYICAKGDEGRDQKVYSIKDKLCYWWCLP